MLNTKKMVRSVAVAHEGDDHMKVEIDGVEYEISIPLGRFIMSMLADVLTLVEQVHY